MLWPAIPLRVYLAAGLLTAACGATWWTTATHYRGVITQIKLDAVQTQLSGYKATMSALETQRVRSAEIVADATAEAGRLRQALATQRAKYNQAVKEEPECSEQASQPLRCPPAW